MSIDHRPRAGRTELTDQALDAPGRRSRPFANGGVYVKFAGFDDERNVSRPETVGSNAVRIEQVRAAYDPDNLFEAAARRP